jgi:hypothetical protein
MPDYTRFTFESVRADSNDTQYFFTAKYGQGPPIVTDGYGGWEVSGRPRDIGLTEWKGRNPMAIRIPFMVDNWFESIQQDPQLQNPGPGVRVEQQITQLERLCGIGGSDVPPTFKVFSDGVIPHDYNTFPNGQWVIENVDWNEDVEIRNAYGNRVRCGGSVVIRQFIKPQVFGRLGAKVAKQGRKKVVKKGAAGYYQGRTYITKQGDTLPKIAKRKDVYGDSTKWRKIAQKNNIRDPHKKLKTGTRLGIPFE